MTWLELVIWIVFGAAFGWVVGRFGPRLFPKYRRGTRVVVRYTDMEAYPIYGKYVRRNTIGFHKVEVSPMDPLGWDGRELTVKTSDLSKVES